MPSFSKRSVDEEIMDDLHCSGEVVFQTLRELEIINRLLGGNKITISGIHQLVKEHFNKRSFTIADLGCGGGDILKLISSWGKENDLLFTLKGIDANPNIIDFAKANTPENIGIEYAVVNIFSEEFSRQRYDIIVATLFTHHFTDDQLIALFTKLKTQISVGIVINDLHRHWLAFFSIKFLTRIFSRSNMVKFDAPLSVLRGFRRKDFEFILQKAGIQTYSLHWKWAFRWQLIIPQQ